MFIYFILGWNLKLDIFNSCFLAYKDFKKDVIEDHKKLRIAAKEGNTDEIRRLLSCGITNVNCKDICGSTPLHESASNGVNKSIQLLSGSVFNGMWMTYDRFNSTYAAHTICQLK